MANLIDYTYFINDINIPAQYLTGTSELISDYIERYEKECLVKLLGYDLYKAVIADQVTYSDLINGADYTIGGYTREWVGLKNAELDSLIAYYVYYHFVKDNVNSLQGVGAVISQTENASRTSPDLLMVKAWNRYIELRETAREFISVNSASYPKWLYTIEHKTNLFGI